MVRKQVPVFIDRPVAWWYKVVLWFIVGGPFLALGVVIRQLVRRKFGWLHFVFSAISYVYMALGVTVGLHRYFTHQSFKANRKVKAALAIGGQMALEGPIIRWCSDHHHHHQNSDTETDLHSPWKYRLDRKMHEPETVMDLVLGLLWAHVRWIGGNKSANPERYVKYLLKDADVVWFSKTYPLWAGLSLVLPIMFGVLVAWLRRQPLMAGALQGVAWGLIRIGMVHHVTWSINSICHVFGEHTYFTGPNDHSGNVRWLSKPTMGESFHNKHHALPDSALHGENEKEDISYRVILWLAKMGWVWDVKVPTPEQVAAKLRLQREFEERRAATSKQSESA